MDHIEGSLRVHRLSHETEPEPWTYEISFAPYAASSILPACDVVGDDQLERALRYGLGLREPHLDSSVQKARPDQPHRLGLEWKTRALVYRGQKVVPRQRWSFGWFATVGHWDVEDHEVQIET
jgi:hypothetical protein